MTELPPDEGLPDESSPDGVDERYRRASNREIGRPSGSMRHAVLQHAADLAAQRASAKRPVDIDQKRRAANQVWRRPLVYGGVAAAALAGLLIAPRFLTTPSPTRGVTAAGPAPLAPDTEAADAPAPADAPARADSPAPAPADASRSIAAKSSIAVAPRARELAAAPSASFGTGVPHPIDAASALRQAAALGDLRRLRALIAEKPEIDSRDPAGRSALMLAVLNGRADAVDLLLASGADANAADANGTTPLQAALERNRTDITKALRRAGAR